MKTPASPATSKSHRPHRQIAARSPILFLEALRQLGFQDAQKKGCECVTVTVDNVRYEMCHQSVALPAAANEHLTIVCETVAEMMAWSKRVEEKGLRFQELEAQRKEGECLTGYLVTTKGDACVGVCVTIRKVG